MHMQSSSFNLQAYKPFFINSKLFNFINLISYYYNINILLIIKALYVVKECINFFIIIFIISFILFPRF